MGIKKPTSRGPKTYAAERLRLLAKPGALIGHSDRTYEVQANGSWRRLLGQPGHPELLKKTPICVDNRSTRDGSKCYYHEKCRNKHREVARAVSN